MSRVGKVRACALRASRWNFAALATVGLGLLLGLSLLRPQAPLLDEALASIGADSTTAAPTRLPVGAAPVVAHSGLDVAPTRLAVVACAPPVELHVSRTPIYLRDRVLRL